MSDSDLIDELNGEEADRYGHREWVDSLRHGGRDNRLLTVPEAAEMLRVSNDTAYRWGRTGVVPSLKIGGLRFFPENQLCCARQSLGRRDEKSTNRTDGL